MKVFFFFSLSNHTDIKYISDTFTKSQDKEFLIDYKIQLATQDPWAISF